MHGIEYSKKNEKFRKKVQINYDYFVQVESGVLLNFIAGELYFTYVLLFC